LSGQKLTIAARRKNPELEQLRAFCLNVIDFEAERNGGMVGIFARLRESISTD
jgi:hypothetical protein